MYGTLKIMFGTKRQSLMFAFGCYWESTNIGHTVYFTKHTGHLKMQYSRIFSLSEHNKHTKLQSNVEKIKEIAFLNVLCVL